MNSDGATEVVGEGLCRITAGDIGKTGGDSTLDRADPAEMRGGVDAVGEEDWETESITDGEAGPRRPKNDNSPVPFFLGSTTNTGSSFSFSTTRHPGGKRSSLVTSGLDLTDVSHAVDPLDAMYRAKGLARVIETFRVRRSASAIDFPVKVFENWT